MPVTEASKRDEQGSLVGRCARIFGLVLALKILFLFLDPTPSFSFDDSGAYLATAIINYIPLDRSFLYGMLLEPAVRIQALMPIVVAQALLSTAGAALVGFALLRYFGGSMRLASLLSLLCAVEPLQLSMERFVMTDTVATFGFTCFVCAGLEYLRARKLWWLAAAELIGVFLIAIRISYLPIVLVSTALLPVLTFGWRSGERPRSAFRSLALALVFSICFSQLLLLGYRHWYGSLVHKKPAYNYRDGEFLLGDFAPILQPGDFPAPVPGKTVLGRVKFPLANPEMRAIQRWMDGGVVESLRTVVGDEDAANAIAKTTVEHAVLRNPSAALRLVFFTYQEFFNLPILRERIRWEQDQINAPSPGSASMIARVFGIDTRKAPVPSLTKLYVRATAGWSAILVTFPFLYATLLAFRFRQLRAAHVLMALYSLAIVAGSVAATEAANPRYLTGLAWMTFLMAGSLVTLWRRPLAE